jgi:hypothetical protein
MPFTVTRQLQWPEGTPVVEVSAGGLDYTNPDALVQRYAGEFETFDDPRKAVAVAIAICKSWRKDGERRARIGHGATGGMTMPFDPCTFAQAMAWAERRYAELPKCDACGELLGKETYHKWDSDEKFCSEYCVERGGDL